MVAEGCAAAENCEFSGGAQPICNTITMSNQNSGEGIHISTAIAVDKDKNSPHAVRWTIDNQLKKNSSIFLVHVRTQILQPRTLLIVLKIILILQMIM